MPEGTVEEKNKHQTPNLSNRTKTAAKDLKSLIDTEDEESADKELNSFNRDLSKTKDNISSFSNSLNESKTSNDLTEIRVNKTEEEARLNPQPKKVIIPGNISKNIAFKTSTVNVSAMSIRTNGKYVETERALRTHAIRVEFKMFNNSNILPGNKEIYVVIENPKRKIINERGTFMLSSGDEVPYTDQTVTYFDNKNISVSILTERFIQKIIKGTYVVKIYIEGYLTGQTFLLLT